MLTRSIFLFLFLTLAQWVCGQGGVLYISVTSEGAPLPFANLFLTEADRVVATDVDGSTTISGLSWGEHTIQAQGVGLLAQTQTIVLSESSPSASLSFDLQPDVLSLEQAVVTGTRTFQRRTDAPVMVGIIDQKLLSQTQSCDLREGLQFQPGLRVETDCQTCNYSQLRINGLGGGYSQILINGRPTFSQLTGLYGLEQIPSALVDRIEVVRGSGSAIYGSSAVGGTVNVITRVPQSSEASLQNQTRLIGGEAWEQQWNAVGVVGSENRKTSAAVMLALRDRQAYDHNGDGFSEIPELTTQAAGVNLHWLPRHHQKLDFSLTATTEERYGGDLKTAAPHQARQAESRESATFMGTVDYQWNRADGSGSWIAYLSGQHTDRSHFTGVQPDDAAALQAYLANPPYGTSLSQTGQAGVQWNRKSGFFPGRMVISVGAEAIVDAVRDEIPAYLYLIDQSTRNVGAYLQADWQLNDNWTFLTGFRSDFHNLVAGMITSPRASVMFRPMPSSQFRVSVGRGFRAPQAFDSDLHIAFAGGGISRVQLADDLREERSTSASVSWNRDWVRSEWIAGFTLEGFYTRLDGAFALETIGSDEFGLRFEKQNGQGATVQGFTLEGRANLRQRWQLQGGITVQQSEFDQAVETLPALPGRRTFLRTPNRYGFANLSFTPNLKWSMNASLVYTGRMVLAHFAGAPEQAEDAYVISDDFWDTSLRVRRTFDLSSAFKIEASVGVKNLTNAYQTDFDSGKNRDSNYVYGPGLPRTFTAGVKLKGWSK